MKQQENNNNNNTGKTMLPNKTQSLISKGMDIIYIAMEEIGTRPIKSEISYCIVDTHHNVYEPNLEGGVLVETVENALEDLKANYQNNEYWRRIEFTVYALDTFGLECHYGTLLVEFDEKYEPIKMRFDIGSNNIVTDEHHFHISGKLDCA